MDKNFIEKQNPKVLVVDLNFSNYEDMSRNYTSPDMVLADALGYYDNIVLATALRTPYRETANYDSSKILDYFSNPYSPSSDTLNMYIDNKTLDENISYYAHTPIPNIFTNSTTMGVTNLVTSRNKDENVRYSQPVYKLIKGNKEYYLPSIALATLMKKEGIGKLIHNALATLPGQVGTGIEARPAPAAHDYADYVVSCHISEF